MGTFLEADLSFLETQEQKVARILVNINLREGLAESINLDWGPVIIPQILDYENIPFRCRCCHAYGHPAYEFTLPKLHFGVRKKGHVTSTEGQPEKIVEPPGFAHIHVEEPACDPVREEPIISSPASAEEHPVSNAQVQDMVLVNSPTVPSCPGISTPPLSPHVNLFLNHVSYLGCDWIEGLRNLSFSGRVGSSFPPFVPTSTPPPVPSPYIVEVDSAPAGLALSAPELFLAVTEPSSVCLEPDPGTPCEEPCPSPTESSDSVYFLRSRSKTVSGLAKSSPVRRGRGRKTNLSKAQSRAKEDLMDGKQLTIESALRAKKAMKRGRK